MPRPKRRGPATGPAADLQALEAEAAAAAAGGDKRAVAIHRQVLSWLDMWQRAGNDPETGELFAIFADEGRHKMAEWWANPRPEP